MVVERMEVEIEDGAAVTYGITRIGWCPQHKQ